MALTIAVTDRNLERIRLQITNPNAYNIGKVMRTDANGVHSVRTEAGALPTTAATLTLLDYEAPMLWHSVVQYDVYDAGNVVRGSVVIDETSPYWAEERGGMYLGVPLYPSYGLTLNTGADPAQPVMTSYTDTHTGQSTVHQVVNRSDPAVVLRPGGYRTGRFTLACPSLASSQQVAAILNQPQVFLLRQSDQNNLDLYFVTAAVTTTHSDENWTQTPQPERRWFLDVEFIEVAWPTGVIVPVTVWTYADVLAAYGDYNAVAATFATYADLLERIT
jgi:hypothetical protein